MRTALLLLLSSVAALAQQETNRLLVIPSSTFTSVGEVDFQSKAGTHFTGLAGADTIGANHVFRLPPVDLGGCVNSDGAYNLSMGPCGGANSMTVSAANPLLLYSHFRDDDAALYFSYSRDYLNFRPVAKTSVYNATNVRDPSVYFDGTTFWILISPEGVTPCEPQLVSSTDLIHFSARVNINLNPFLSSCVAAPAPEWAQGKTGDPIGFWVALGNGTSIYSAPYFITYNPAVNGVTPTAATAVTVTGTSYQTNCGKMNIFDQYPYYDAGSNEYYLHYVDWYDHCATTATTQYIAYAKSSTLLGTYAQQTADQTDYFNMSSNSEGPAIVPLADSTTRYGIAGCVRNYADTWFLSWGAGPPASPNQGNRSYHWKYIDSCPSTLGGNPFAVIEPMVMVVNVGYGAPANQVNWVQGPMFSSLTIGQTLTIQGSNYTIATIPNPSALTLTTSPPQLLNTQVIVPGIGSPVNISSEQGTVILLTNQASANIVYQAEDYWRADPTQQSNLTIGGKGRGPFPLTVQSDYAHYGLSYDESATMAAGGPDPAATYGASSYALWSACGVDILSCPQPTAGEASWIFRYSGFNNAIQLDHQNTDSGETSIGFSNGTTQYTENVEGYPAVTGSALGNKVSWKLGTNNQFFGPIASNGNLANNWFYIYNQGLGSHSTASGLVNPGFEVGPGTFSGWSTSGTVAVVSTAAHGGKYSATLASGASINQIITGLTANATYVVTAWVQSSVGSATGVTLTVEHYPSFTGPIVQNCASVSTGCIAQFSWYQIGMQYTTDSSGDLYIELLHPSGSGTAYVDDIDIYPINSTQGAFALGISPSSGEVRANYGLTIGNGDISHLSQFPSASFDSPSAGLLNIGDGIFGHSNAFVSMGGLTLPNGSDGTVGHYEIAQYNVTGILQEMLHHATDDNLYLDNYGKEYGCTLTACAPITGGGNIYIRAIPGNGVLSSTAGNVVVQGNLVPYRIMGLNAQQNPNDSVIFGDNANVNFFVDRDGNGGGSGAQMNFGYRTTKVVGFFDTFTWYNNSTDQNALLILQSKGSSGTPSVAGIDEVRIGAFMDSSGTYRSVNQTIPPSGSGTEMFFSGGTGFLAAYNRTANAYLPLVVGGSTINFAGPGSGATLQIGGTQVTGSTVVSGTAGGAFTWNGGAWSNFWDIGSPDYWAWDGSAWNAGVSTAVTCTPHNITVGVSGGGGGSVTISACTAVNTNAFIGGIKRIDIRVGADTGQVKKVSGPVSAVQQVSMVFA